MRIAINGTGVAGPALAWWFRKYGYEPVLFERAPALRTGGYMIDFWGVGYDIAEKMGVLPAIKKKSYRMEWLRIVDERGKQKGAMNVERMGAVVSGRFISIARSDLAASLYEACDGIETHFGRHVTGIEQQKGGVKVRFSDGSEGEFDLVVGADGLHSQVRELAFGPEEGFAHDLGVYVAAFTVTGYQPREELAYVMHPSPKRQMARVSLRDDRTLFLLTFRSELAKRAPENAAEQKKLLHDVFREVGWEAPAMLERLDSADDLYFDRVSQIRMDRWCKGRVALVGDAAACASLLAGEGTGLAITEAYVLVGELHRAHGDYQKAFLQYEERLREFLRKKQKSATKMLSVFAPSNRFDMAVVRTILSASSIPFLSKFLLGSTLRDHIALPDYRTSKS